MAETNVTERYFSDVKVQRYSFRCPRRFKPTEQAFFVQDTCAETCGLVDVWITVSFRTFFPEMQKVNNLQKNRRMQDSWQTNG